ncbi:polysaccharide biosynthesis tyrosine autokinase [Cellulomonas sp. S1-8]|uniref:polysaccharide biosynthesis tyrosine autokinase n=1 Tax=Cellulomonas sp. S1-8 TaxID=2904790 RepID=UPI002243007D|nr:polysaccharide biosynthesis tyrosine autokinase [Cellulomonas sp. S1-8]UZN04299.1 Wzz/FepE/Etk N-terminal domain-containing protein [Cellulomonas sp. S1-8]
MDLRELLGALRKQWVPILALTLLGAVAAFAFSVNQQKMWTAQATILVRPASGQSTADLNSGAVFVERVVGTYAALARTPVVLDPVADELGLESSSELRGKVTAAISSGTTFISVSATWRDAEGAARVANAVADEMQIAIVDAAPLQQGQPSIVVSSVAPAVAPGSPSSPDVTANVLVGTFAGFLVGLGFVLLRSALDSRVRTVADARRLTSSPVLGEIAPPRRPSRSAIPDADPWAEDYRRLRTNLRLLDVGERPASVLVTSCTADEGAATVSLGLARTAVEGGLRTVLVEADLRHPRLAQDLRLPAGPGLSDLVATRGDIAAAVHVVDGVDVLPAGAAVASPGDLVTSPAMGDLLARLVEGYDLVVCLAPPVLTVTDAAALGAGTHGVVLVVGRPRVTSDQVTEAVNALSMAGASLLGVVMNDAASVAPARLSRRAADRPGAPGTGNARRQPGAPAAPGAGGSVPGQAGSPSSGTSTPAGAPARRGEGAQPAR